MNQTQTSTDAPQSKPEKIYRYPCPKCGKGPVIMFTPDLDICEFCDMQMEPQPNEAERTLLGAYEQSKGELIKEIEALKEDLRLYKEGYEDIAKRRDYWMKEAEALKASNAGMREALESIASIGVRIPELSENASYMKLIAKETLEKYPEL